MAKPEQISGASIPMKIGNKEYQAKTLSDKDYDELNAYCRFKFIEEGKESVDRMRLPKDARQEMLTSMLLASSQVTFSSAEGAKIINSSNEGIARTGWQMIKANHEFISLEEFTREVIGDESQGHLMSTISSIYEAFHYLNVGDNDDVSEDEGDSDKEPKSN